MLPPEFETAILASKQWQTYALDRAATGTGDVVLYKDQFYTWFIEFAILLLDFIFQEFKGKAFPSQVMEIQRMEWWPSVLSNLKTC